MRFAAPAEATCGLEAWRHGGFEALRLEGKGWSSKLIIRLQGRAKKGRGIEKGGRWKEESKSVRVQYWISSLAFGI